MKKKPLPELGPNDFRTTRKEIAHILCAIEFPIQDEYGDKYFRFLSYDEKAKKDGFGYIFRDLFKLCPTLISYEYPHSCIKLSVDFQLLKKLHTKFRVK